MPAHGIKRVGPARFNRRARSLRRPRNPTVLWLLGGLESGVELLAHVLEVGEVSLEVV